MIQKNKGTHVDEAIKETQVQAAAEMYGEKAVKNIYLNAGQPISNKQGSQKNKKDKDAELKSKIPQKELAGKDISTTLSQKEENLVTKAALTKAEFAGYDISTRESQKQGIEEAIKEEAKQQIRDVAKMQELVDTVPRPLLEITSTFPFDLFPNRLTVEETRVNFVFRQFFATEQVYSISIKDIMEVTVQTAIIFATFRIISRTFNPTNLEPLEINYVKISEAQRARRLVEGLRIAIQQNIDTSKLKVDELIAKADELGKIHHGV